MEKISIFESLAKVTPFLDDIAITGSRLYNQQNPTNIDLSMEHHRPSEKDLKELALDLGRRYALGAILGSNPELRSAARILAIPEKIEEYSSDDQSM